MLKPFAKAKLAVVFFLGLIMASGLGQAPCLAGPLTLQKAVETALAYSPNLVQAQEEKNKAELSEKEAFTYYLPVLSTQYAWKKLDSAPVIHVGGNTFQTGEDRVYQWSASLSQPLFTGFRISSTHKLSQYGVDLARIKVRLAELDVAVNVKQAYFEYLNSLKFLGVARQSVSLLKSHLKISQDFYEVGIIPINDVLKTKVELAEAQQNLVKADNDVSLRRAQLNSIMGLPLDRKLDLEDILKYHQVKVDYPKASIIAKTERPELKALAIQLKQADQSILQAKSEYYPQLSLQGSYISNSDSPELGDSLFYDPSGWQVITSMDWSFWEWGRTKHRVGKSRADKRRLKAVLRDVEDQVDLQVKQTYLFLRESEKNINTAKTSITHAKENYRITRERFQEQLTTNTEVLDARIQLTRAQINYYRALTVYNVAWAKLERAMGRGLGDYAGVAGGGSRTGPQ